MLFLLLQRLIVGLDKLANLVRHTEQFFPLLAVQGNGEAAQSVHGEPALLTHFQEHRPASGGLLQCFIFSAQAFELCFHFFFRCHSIQTSVHTSHTTPERPCYAGISPTCQSLKPSFSISTASCWTANPFIGPVGPNCWRVWG